MHYTVCTPQFWDYSYMGPERLDPPEYGADCVDVESPNKKQAKVEAVRKMRKEGMSWVNDQDSDKASPFTGLQVFDIQCEHGFCGCTLSDCIQPNPEYLLLSECPECLKGWEEEYAKEFAEQSEVLV